MIVKKNYLFIVFSFLMLNVIPGVSKAEESGFSTSSIKLSYYDQKTTALGYLQTLTFVSIQNRGDEKAHIENIEVNRGNCNVLSWELIPVSLSFGEKEDIQVSSECDVLEVDLYVNGEWFTYEW